MLETCYRESQIAELSLGPICYLRKGRGSAVILLHGVPLSMLTWRHTIRELSRRATVVAVDMKGFGRSHKALGSSYTPEGHAEVIAELMDKLDLPAAHLVGSSYGCAVAVELATSRPERVGKLVLINSVGYPGGPHSTERLLRIGAIGAAIQPMLRWTALGKRLFASGLRKSYADPSLADPALIDAYFELLRQDGGERAFLTTLRQFDEDALAAKLPSIQHPTLILWGAQDRVLPVDHAYKHHQAIRGSELHIFEGCGHLPHEEASEQVSQRIARFLGVSPPVD